MKTAIILILLSFNLFAQDSTMNIRGHQIKLGMSTMDVWDILNSEFNIIEDEAGIFYISDSKDEPVSIVYFKDDKAVKIIKDWGTSYKSNVGQVFKTLWNIFKQYDQELDAIKIIPLQTFTPKGDKTSLLFYINENRYLEISIQLSVTIFEVIEAKES